MRERGKPRRVEPLYRKVNTTARGVHHDKGGDYRHERAAKATSTARTGSMGAPKQRGLDYTPLYKFLLSRVGDPWPQIHSEAVARLDREAPIFHLVARLPEERRPYVILGERSYYSGLYVDDAGTLQIVDPSVTVETLEPGCACCTHTFNGVPFAKKYA